MTFRLSWPNRITILRIFLIPLFVLALVQAREGEPGFRWAALGLLALVCLGDALDGWLARKLHSRSRLGAILDPLADKLLMTAGYIVMASMLWPDPRIPKWLTVLVISRDALMVVFFLALVALGTGFRQLVPSFLGKLCTTLQMVTLVAVVAAPAIEPAIGDRASGILFPGFFLATAFLTIVTSIDYLWAARAQFGAPEASAVVETDEPEPPSPL